MKKYLLLITTLFLYYSCSNDNSHVTIDTKEAVSIAIGGNAYITAGPETEITETGLASWKSAETTLSVFFRTNTDGNLKLFLKYSTDTEGNEIEASYKGKRIKVKLPKDDSTIYLGEIEQSGIGYVQVDLKGVSLKGNTFCQPTHLLVTGSASKDMTYVGDFSYYWGRRGPSVHMGYQIPENVTAEWFYNEVTVPVGQDPVGSYFMANGFGEGYFGIQVNSKSERRVLFSVWSPYETDDPNAIPESHKIKLVKKGKDVHTGEFGNEGSGGQSYLKHTWKAGETNKFLARVRPAKNGYSEYTAYFQSPQDGKWQLIAQFLRPNTTTYYTRPHSFLENFIPEMGYLGRRASYNNQWIYTKEGKWIELTKGKFTADETARKDARKDYKGGADDSGFFLNNGGFLSDFATMNSEYTRTATNNQPNINWSELE